MVATTFVVPLTVVFSVYSDEALGGGLDNTTPATCPPRSPWPLATSCLTSCKGAPNGYHSRITVNATVKHHTHLPSECLSFTQSHIRAGSRHQALCERSAHRHPVCAVGRPRHNNTGRPRTKTMGGFLWPDLCPVVALRFCLHCFKALASVSLVKLLRNQYVCCWRGSTRWCDKQWEY